ncbi:MAG TPA: cadherin-like domain-containing protein, partial [Mycobacteriales bacterium]|nr:cadherin-like domain-containing protein [Mycobacteriales bacterium]
MPTFAFANVTVTGTTSFASLDGGPDDADHTVNGVFTVNGNLIVNGTINCNDTGGSSSACPMSFNVSGDITINAGGALYAEDRSGTGTGGAITIAAGGNLVMHSATATLPAAIISSNAKSSSASTGGAITASVSGTVSIENGATIDAGAINAAAGKITLLAGGHIDVSGNVLSGPSRTLLSTLHTGQALDGGTSNQSGGEIYIHGTSYSEPGVTIGSTANIISQGQANGAGPVTIEGCGVVVKGLVAALAMKDYNARVDIRSGKSVTVDARDLGVANATLGRNGQIRVDAPTGAADHHTLDIYAGTAITISGPDPAASSLFVLSGLPGVNTSKSDGATMHIMAVGGPVLTGTVTGSGNLIDDGRVTSGDGGGHIEISAQGDVSLDTARILAIGDSNTNNTNRNGGTIAVRSYSGNVVWTNGVGDVTPTGSNVPSTARGTIALTACGTVNTSGSTFPTNGAPVGPFPVTTTGNCSPATPSLPITEAALPVCNNPPVANNASVTTNEDNAVTITMTASDPDGDSLTFTIVTPPAHGTLSAIFNPTPTSAQVTYTPNANYNGSDSFTFKADDGKGGTSVGTITVTINPVNDPPTFNLGANPVTSNEDAGAQSIANYASSISPGPTADEAS